MLVNHRDEDNGHGAGRTGHLQIRPAEDRSDHASDHGRDDPSLRTKAGARPKGQGQRQRHHGDRQTSKKIGARVPSNSRPVGPVRQQFPHVSDAVRRACFAIHNRRLVHARNRRRRDQIRSVRFLDLGQGPQVLGLVRCFTSGKRAIVTDADPDADAGSGWTPDDLSAATDESVDHLAELADDGLLVRRADGRYDTDSLNRVQLIRFVRDRGIDHAQLAAAVSAQGDLLGVFDGLSTVQPTHMTLKQAASEAGCRRT